MRVIDTHTHCFPDDLAGRAIDSLESLAPWKAVGEGTIASLIDSMDTAGIDAAVVCTIATKPGQVPAIFDWCKTVRSERIIPFLSVHYSMPDACRWLERFAEAGFRGIKLHPMYQDFPADDPCLDSIYAAAAELGLIIAMHSGCDVAFPDEDDRATPVRLRSIIDRFPKLKLLCLHLGGWRMWDDVERYLVGTNVYFETSFTLGYIDPERKLDIIRRHGIDRVMFGTDWPWRDQARNLEHLRRIGLTPGELESVLSGAATRLLRLDDKGQPAGGQGQMKRGLKAT